MFVKRSPCICLAITIRIGSIMTRAMTTHPSTAFFVFALLISTASLRAQDESPIEPVSPVSEATVSEASPVSPVQESVARPETRAKEEVDIRIEMAKLKGEMRKTAAENQRVQSELNAAIETLKRENADLKKAAINRDNERNVLVQKLAAAQLAAREKSKAADDASGISAELASARNTIDSLNAGLKKLGAELNEEKARAEKASAQARESVDKTNEKLAVAQKELSALRVDLAAARQGSIALGGQIQALTAENRRVSAQMSEESAKTAKVSDDTARNLAAARQETAAAQIEISTLKTKVAELSGQNETILRERNDALAASDALKTQLKTTEAALAEAEKARDELTQRATSVEKQNADAAAAATAVADDLRKQISDGETKLGVALRSYQLRQEEIETLQKQLGETTGETTSLSERLKKLEAKLAETEKRAEANEQAAAQLIVLRENFRQLQIQSADTAGENVRLKTRLAMLAQPQAQPAAPAASAGAMEASAPSAPSRPPSQATASEQPAAVAITSGTTGDSNMRAHTVAVGETLWSIAKKYNGGNQLVNAIYEANRDQLKNPDALTPGMKLVIP